MQENLIAEKFLSVCGDWLEEHSWFDVRGKLGVFSSATVVWLSIQQRLTGNSLQSALSELVNEIKLKKSYVFVNQESKKIKSGKVSFNTGGLSRARKRLSVSDVEELCNAASDQMITPTKRKIFVLDGLVLTIARTKDNLLGFCSTGNGEGELHFPKIKVLGIHDLESGIAKRVTIGDWKTSEVALAKQASDSIPKGSLILGDRGFARPVFLDHLQSAGIDYLVRINDSYGKKLLGNSNQMNDEKTVVWNTKIVKGSSVSISGKIIKFTSSVSGYRSSEFYFFTSDTSLSIKQVADLYLQRVKVEVFIRDIKQTLKMFFVKAKTADNIKKEIYLAYLTFNLIRAIMKDVAIKTKVELGRISFTSTIRLCQSYASLLVNTKTDKELKSLLKQFRENLLQAKLPNRKNKNRSYPRVIKNGKDRYEKAAVLSKSNGVTLEEGK